MSSLFLSALVVSSIGLAVADGSVTAAQFASLALISNAESARCQVFVENLKAIDPSLETKKNYSREPYRDEKTALQIWNQLMIYPGTSKGTNTVLSKARDAKPKNSAEYAAFGRSLGDIGTCRAFIAQNAILKLLESRKAMAFLKSHNTELLERAQRFLDFETRGPHSIASTIERLELIAALQKSGLIKEKKVATTVKELLTRARAAEKRLQYWRQINNAPGPENDFKALQLELSETEKLRPAIRKLVKLSNN